MTSMHSNDIVAKRSIRERLEADMAAFLGRGGEVKQVSPNERNASLSIAFDTENIDRARQNGGMRGAIARSAMRGGE